MVRKIKERRDRRYHATSPRTKPTGVRAPERGASKDRLRRIAGQVATTKRYDAVKVVGRH
jgi:hypothetical protein